MPTSPFSKRGKPALTAEKQTGELSNYTFSINYCFINTLYHSFTLQCRIEGVVTITGMGNHFSKNVVTGDGLE